MRVKEWYGWHFPELKELVKDNALYARVVRAVQSRAFFHDDDCVAKLLPIVLDEALAREIRDAGRASMGQELSATDLQSVNLFAAKLASFFMELNAQSRGAGGVSRGSLRVSAGAHALGGAEHVGADRRGRGRAADRGGMAQIV